MLSILYFVLLVLCVLVTVSFYTLFERKAMSSAHIRMGPNIVSYGGLLQPFSDAIKLFSKEFLIPKNSNWLGAMIFPAMSVVSAVLAWVCLPYSLAMFSVKYHLLILFVIMSLSVYFHFGTGWASNSSYAILGSMRCVAQTISYEVALAFLIMCIIFFFSSYELHMSKFFYNPLVGVLAPWLVLMWAMSILAETNRAPFDFAEGESELVSGFNVEYGSIAFSLLFIAEYASMIFMSYLTSSLFLASFMEWGVQPILIGLVMYWFVWVRVSYPRNRYDKLMSFCWKSVLPVVLFSVLGLMALY